MKISNNKKYLAKYLEKAKMFSNIALLSILKGGTTRHKLTGVFCAFLLINFGFACPINLRVNSLSGCKDMGIAKPINITVSTPVWSVNAPTAFEVDSNGKAKPFSFFAQKITNSTVMLSTEKNLQATSIQKEYARTPTKRVHTKKKLLEYLSIEENAKNKAYYYIISSGNLEQFTNFCKQLPDGIDYGAACTAALILQFFNPQKTTL